MRKVHRTILQIPWNNPSTTLLYIVGVFCGDKVPYDWMNETTSNDEKVTCKRCLKIMEGKHADQ